MYRKHHTRGIVISSKIEGDSDRRVNIFTEHFGLINAKVQGARNLHSKLRASSQDFSFGDFSLIYGKTGWRVVSTRAEQNFYESFKDSPIKIKIIGNILNLIKKLVSEEPNTSFASTKLQAESGLFDIVINFFVFLANEHSKVVFEMPRSQNTTFNSESIALAECLTMTRILHVLGYMRHDPELSIPITSAEIKIKDLEVIAPRRSKMIRLINESLKAT